MTMSSHLIVDRVHMTNSGPHNALGDLVDASGMREISFHVSWSGLSASPDSVLFGVQSTNDQAISSTLYVPLGDPYVIFNGGGFTRPGATDIAGPNTTAGSGIITVLHPPHYVALVSIFTGSFTGTSTVRVYGVRR